MNKSRGCNGAGESLQEAQFNNFEDCKVTLSGLWETSGQGLNLVLFVNLACSTGPGTNFSVNICGMNI